MKQIFFGSLIIELEVGAQCADLWRQEWVNEIENDESVEKTQISGQLFFLFEDVSLANGPITASYPCLDEADILLLPEGYHLS